jgi:hypothetical protein
MFNERDELRFEESVPMGTGWRLPAPTGDPRIKKVDIAEGVALRETPDEA